MYTLFLDLAQQFVDLVLMQQQFFTRRGSLLKIFPFS